MRFRLHGRNPVDGLDCVGLVALAIETGVPTGYTLRTDDVCALLEAVEAAGLVRVTDDAPGDVLLFRAGPGQLHLGISTGAGMIHADARLRQVVERPGPLPWPVLARWRG